MASVLHTILYRGPNLSAHVPIPIDEWQSAVSHFDSFKITDNLKVEHPFKEGTFLQLSLPGSGLWKQPGGSDDNAIRFRFASGTITFIGFSDLSNAELVRLAQILD